MRLFLTGATGFLGSALARHWLAAGHHVSALIRPGSSLNRLQDCADRLDLHATSSDADTRAALRASCPDAVVHLAAVYGRRGESTLHILDANVRLGLLLLDTLVEDPGRHVDFLNSGTAVGPEVSPYALAKHQFSAWGVRMATQHPASLRFLNLRLQHFYGPGDDRSKFTSHVLHACQRNQAELALTAGEQERDFIYVGDVLRAYDTVLAHTSDFAAVDELDVGSGIAPTVRQFVETVRDLVGSTTRLSFGALAYRPNEPMRCVADTRRLRAMGWRPAVDLRDGLARTIREEFGT